MAKKRRSSNVGEQARRSLLEMIKDKKKTTPVEFLLKVMWNKARPMALRLEAAKSAAPYVHKKMPLEMQHSGEVEIITPYIPSRSEIRENLKDELGDDY